MSDTQNTATPQTDKTAAAINELANDEQMVKDIIAAVKAKDWAKLTTMIPSVAQEASKDIAAVEEAIPEIKAGYKTTEFWLVAALLLFNAIYFDIRGVALGWDTNTAIGTVIGVYSIIRGVLKKS